MFRGYNGYLFRMITRSHTQPSTDCSQRTKHILERYYGRPAEWIAQQGGREREGESKIR